MPIDALAAAVLAVDGGNSKADLALVAADGTLLAAVHGPTISHQAVGLAKGMANLRAIADAAAAGRSAGADRSAVTRAAGADRPLGDLGVYCLAGADYPSDVRQLRRGIGGLGLTRETVILNDTFAALRAGSHRPWGVVLICGQGINGAGVAPNGRTIRFDGIGTYSGDWGGGGALGQAAIAAAVRSRDGRGPRTTLEKIIPTDLGVRSVGAMTRAFYSERIPESRVPQLAPIVFRTAAQGDAVARSIVDRLADELVAMASALIRRLRLGRLDPEIVLAGGVFRTTEPGFYERIEQGVAAVAPAARLVRLTAPPVLGAALLGLDRLAPDGTTPTDVDRRLRTALEAWRA
jgi:N-acetylglucosamine kinase-like BadF-type ATPase